MEAPQQTAPQVSLFITKGIRVAIPAGGLQVSMKEDGTPAMSVDLHAGFDVCHVWLQLALDHLSVAESHRARCDAAWSRQEQESMHVLLESEFLAGMQAVVAAAIAMDALYGIVKDAYAMPPELVQSWREKGTARSSQISETMRRAFTLKPKVANEVKQRLHELIKLRDRAVHPDAKCSAFVLHPEFNVGMEWRFVAYRVQNAKACVQFAVSLAAQLLAAETKSAPLRERCAQYLQFVVPVLDECERRYGELFPRAASVAEQLSKARGAVSREAD